MPDLDQVPVGVLDGLLRRTRLEPEHAQRMFVSIRHGPALFGNESDQPHTLSALAFPAVRADKRTTPSASGGIRAQLWTRVEHRRSSPGAYRNRPRVGRKPAEGVREQLGRATRDRQTD